MADSEERKLYLRDKTGVRVMGIRTHGHMDTWRYVYRDIWTYGTHGHMDTWAYGHMDTWIYGHMDTWTYGHMDTWTYGHMNI